MAAQPPNKKTVGFDCEFVKPPPSEYIQSECPVCLLIIREPYQATCCGKKFCKACIEHITDTKKACPHCNEKEFSIYQDKGHKQLLYSLKVRCSHQGEGCQWTGELGQFDNHLNTDPPPKKQLEGCQYVKIDCINNCGDQLQRKVMKKHQNDHCPNRPFSCEHCRVYKATYNDVTQTHWPVCGSFPLSCPNNCPSTIQRQNIDNHVANECPLTTINCDFHHVGCAVKLPRKDMPEHIKTSFLTHISLQATLVGKLETENKQLKAKNTELEQSTKTMVFQNKKLETEIRQLKIEVQQSMEAAVSRFTKLETEIKQLKAKNTSLELLAKSSLLANSQPTVPLGCSIPLAPPILTMTNYQQHKRDDDNWYSPPLYTHPRGYKICLIVNANGWSDAKGTHISVFVYLMKGEFDDTLKWPFRGSISYQLLDQANGTDHKTHTTNYGDKWGDEYCGRVTEGERSPSGLGAPRFIAHSALEPKYLHNDTLFFQVHKVELKKN